MHPTQTHGTKPTKWQNEHCERIYSARERSFQSPFEETLTCAIILRICNCISDFGWSAILSSSSALSLLTSRRARLKPEHIRCCPESSRAADAQRNAQERELLVECDAKSWPCARSCRAVWWLCSGCTCEAQATVRLNASIALGAAFDLGVSPLQIRGGAFSNTDCPSALNLVDLFLLDSRWAQMDHNQ
jgi:hypothetical protein